MVSDFDEDGNMYPPNLREARVIGRIVQRALDGDRMLAGGTDEQFAALLGAFGLDIGTGWGVLADAFRERRTAKAGGLNYDQLVAACKNIGYDLACGGCAAIFYTGTGATHTCGRKEEPITFAPAEECCHTLLLNTPGGGCACANCGYEIVGSLPVER